MPHLRALALLLVLALAAGAVAYQDKDKDAKDKDKKEEKKDDKGKKDDKKIKGQLPPYYKQLGLSDTQRQKVLKVRAEYKEKIDELKKKIDTLKEEQDEATEKVLTPEQVKELKRLRLKEKKDK
jgi:Spy/CpxP family protein refolding chaperone